jgi:hypothetical protein
MRAPVAESPYHSRCQNRLVTGRVVGKDACLRQLPIASGAESLARFTNLAR